MTALKGFGKNYLEFYFEELKELEMYLKQRFELYKGNRAGVKCFNHAINLMMKVCKK